MPDKSIFRVTGSEKLKRWYLIPLFLGPAYVLAGAIAKMGIPIGGALIVLPCVFGFMYFLFQYPVIGVWGSFCLSFIAAGLSRYVPIPWGLFLDGLLTLGWIALLFKNFKFTDWSPLNNGLMLVCCAWFGLILLEIVNPDAKSIVAWFYAMRTIGLQTLMMFGLIFMLMRHVKDYRRMMNVMIWFSIAGALWGMKQKFLFLDGAENRWLNTGENGNTHILFGVLRAFSFYSDAGQFGASQGHAGVVFGILAIFTRSTRFRVFCLLVCLAGLYGMMISGTRGAIAVPAAGGIMFLILRRNIPILIAGILLGIGVFVFFKYTTLLQSNYEIRRMRTAFDPNDASLQVRLDNQRKLKTYLASRPFGGGIGSTGSWGERFTPNTYLANAETDSWYVIIWTNTGIVGLCLHLFILFFILITGAYNVMFKIQDSWLRGQIAALVCGMFGIMVASYGNGVFGQFPTGILMYTGMVFMFIAPGMDKAIMEREAQREEQELSEQALK